MKTKNSNCKQKEVVRSFFDERDNSKYEIVEIGKQIWLAENMKFKSPKSICYKKRVSNCESYGRLYPFDELEIVCPDDWRVPNIEDWKILQSHFQNDSIYALLDTTNWPITDKHSNKSGFSLKGVGYQMARKVFFGKGKATTIWLNQMNKYDEYYHAHIYGGEGIYFEKSGLQTNEILHAHPIEDLKNRKFSIRCLCDKK